MRVSLKYNSYNARRYSRPWIAKITSWPVGGKPEIEWGRYLGDDSDGEVEIDANPGDIVRSGQKDRRGNNGSADWYIVDQDGSLDSTDAPEARKHWDAIKAKAEGIINPITLIPDDVLLDEVRRRGLLI